VYLIGSTKFYEACVSTAGNTQFCVEALILAWKSFLSRDVTQRQLVVTDVSGRPIGLIFKRQSRPLNIPFQSREEKEENRAKPESG
jgi:hypothetical protein